MIHFLIASLFTFSSAHASPCCSGSSLVPSIITTDSKAQVSARASQSAVIGSSKNDGSATFNRNGNEETTSTVTLTFAYLLTPRWQAHVEVPMSRRYRAIDAKRSTNWGAGDVSFGATYEVIEELRDNQLAPRMFVFVDATAPTGRSAEESGDLLKADVHGRGAWSFTGGLYSIKNLADFDINLLAEHRKFLQQNSVTPGSLTVLEVGAGYNFSDYRLGLSAGPSWEATTTNKGTKQPSSAKLVWNVGVQASILLKETWSIIGSYNDQTLLGPTYNSPLARTFSVSGVHRFE